MWSAVRMACTLFAAVSLLTGIAYPLAVTGIAQLIFPAQANGSLIRLRRTIVGSQLIGQYFSSPRYFWGRPSATIPPYNGASSAASDLSPSGKALQRQIAVRVSALRAVDPTEKGPVPVDLVTSSGSGLDPGISIAGALYQVDRVAKARGLSPEVVRSLVAKYTQTRTFGVLGEPVVNVLELNLALDRLGK